MLKHLHLKNLILIESCNIDFEPGFTVITGETGAGKTALTEALQLTIGQRADTDLIRAGEDKAVVEASFDLSDLPHVRNLLEESGIEISDGDLIIRREISRSGKNRCLINCQMVPLPVLQAIGLHLLERVGQSSYIQLKTSDAHRAILDAFGEIDHSEFLEAWNGEKAIRQQLENLTAKDATRERELDFLQSDLEMLEKAAVQEGEEEKLFDEYNRVSHSQELVEKIQTMRGLLSETSHAILPQLSRLRPICQSLIQIDPKLADLLQPLQDAAVQFSDIANEIESYQSQVEADPKRYAYLEERLSLINKLKRKFGANMKEHLDALKQKAAELENLPEEIASLKTHLQQAQNRASSLAKALTTARQSAAKRLEKELSTLLQELNMPGALLLIRITPLPRSSTGDDEVQFWMQVNAGEGYISIKENSSGGELSRVLFAIKSHLAEKNQTPTLIFDEIDGNVGGETATIMGEKLLELAKHRQILCITHFPQVATKGQHHLRVSKEELDGRTVGQIEALDKMNRQKELVRMLGGTSQVRSLS